MRAPEHLTMTAVLSQRHADQLHLSLPTLGEMAVWDPADDLSDPALAFQRVDQRGMRLLAGVGLAALALVVVAGVAQLVGL
jgi:hypothetical protein